MARYELSDGTSNKFWEIDLDGTSFTVRFGRIGTNGQSQTKSFPSPAKAQAEHDKLVKEKTGKGYALTGAAPSPKPAVQLAPKVAPSVAAAPVAPPPAPEPAPKAGAPARATARVALPPLAEIFAEVRAAVKKELAEKNKYLRAKDPGWAELLAAAGERYAAGDAKSKLDEAVESTIGDRCELDLMLEWWHVKEGPAFAVRAWAHTWRWDPWGHAFENPGEAIYRYGHNSVSEYLVVRKWAKELDAASYAEALDAAQALRAVAPLTLRCGLACAFPDEAAWAEADADEILALDPNGGHPVFARTGFVLGVLASLRDEKRITALAKRADKSAYETRQITDELADIAGEAAVDALAGFVDAGGGRSDVTIALVKSLTRIEGPRVAEAFAARLHDKVVRPIATDWLGARIALAVPALARVLTGRSKSADFAARLVIQLAKSDRAAFDAALAVLGATEANAVRVVLGALVVTEEASAAELPPVLRDPPWLRQKRAAAPAITLALTPLKLEEKVVWTPGELGEYDAPLPRLTPLIDVETLIGWKNLPKDLKPKSKEMDAFVEKAFVKSVPGEYFKRVHYVSTMLHVCSDAAALKIMEEQGPEKLCDANLHDLEYVLSRFELRAFGPLLALAGAQPWRLSVLARVASPRLAPLMADAFARMKKVGPVARAWFLRFPDHAAAGLIPLALGTDKKLRQAAERALRWMSQNDKVDAIRVIADRYGAPARAATDALLAFDPLDDVPAKPPKPPAWLDPSSLPRPVLRGSKKALSVEAVANVLAMLQFSPVDPPYAGLAEVKAACTDESLAELAWALSSEWLVSGAVGKEDWALSALGHFGTDEIARRLAPKIRAWPGESAHARAVKGLDVLAQIGTDVALMHLDGIAQKLKFKGLQDKAREKIAEVAESRGLTREELADRLVPDLDLDADGTKTLDFGARTFKATFDEHLSPVLLDETGKRQKDLPKPGKSDDAEKAEAATAWWKAAKKDVKTLSRRELLRLELAMCAERTWDAPTFRTFLVEHPLVFHLVRRLVWATYQNGKPTATFRVAEDRSLADEDDAAFTLPPDATLGIVHLLALPAKTAAKWGERLSDYELIQPFPQLQRPTFALEPKEKTATALTRYEKVMVPLGNVLGLEDRGWRRGNPQDAGWIWDMHKDLPGGIVATLGLGGGILAGDMSESPKEQELGKVTLAVRGRDGAIQFGTLGAIVFSELVRDLHELRAS